MAIETAIWIMTQKDGTRIGKVGVVGHTGWPVCGDGDTEKYCKEMAENLGLPFLGVFAFGNRPEPEPEPENPGKIRIETNAVGGVMSCVMVTVTTPEGKKSGVNINAFPEGTIAMSRLKGRATVCRSMRGKEFLKKSALTPELMLEELRKHVEAELPGYVEMEDATEITKSMERKSNALLTRFWKQDESLHVEAVR